MGETEADVEPHVPGFGSWHFLPHFNTEDLGTGPWGSFFELSPVFHWLSLCRNWSQSLRVQVGENLKQQFKGREIEVQPAEGRWPLIGAELTYPDYFNSFKDFWKWSFWALC